MPVIGALILGFWIGSLLGVRTTQRSNEKVVQEEVAAVREEYEGQETVWESEDAYLKLKPSAPVRRKLPKTRDN